MRVTTITTCLLTLGLGAALAAAQSGDLLVPAGTLLQCTMTEPDFSSATASAGDPFLCYPRSLQEFGQSVFPRGTYLVGHLEGAHEPGRLFGKGDLLLTIDRLGLPGTDVPLSAKVISVAGYKVNRTGAILGKGHAERDVIEWMLPPLWPWKVAMLPARGPRPELKGEVRLTLRVMDDLSVPQLAENHPRLAAPDTVRPALTPRPEPGWHLFGEPTRYLQPSGDAAAGNVATNANQAWPRGVTLLVTRDGDVVPVTNYLRSGDELLYQLAADGSEGTLELSQIDWGASARANQPRNVRITLRSAPASVAAPQP
ncbi:MAG TPA: hypothetical protein VN709_03035 [Terriglobales bacterium]|nr:hypothetical protein [Terriglobales bacterium]